MRLDRDTDRFGKKCRFPQPDGTKCKGTFGNLPKRNANSPRVTGTVFVREQSRRTEDDRRVVMLIAIVAGLDEKFQGEHMYAIASLPPLLEELWGGPLEPDMIRFLPEDVPIHDYKTGNYRADQILCLPIWRV